jgi:hypothetical protein
MLQATVFAKSQNPAKIAHTCPSYARVSSAASSSPISSKVALMSTLTDELALSMLSPAAADESFRGRPTASPMDG